MKKAEKAPVKAVLLAVAALSATVAAAAHHVFPPVPWERTALYRSDISVEVRDGTGVCQIRLLAEPREHIRDVRTEITPKGLVIDPARAFAAGMRKLVCTTAEIDDASLSGQYVASEIAVAGPPPSSIVTGMTMMRENDAGRKAFHYVPANKSRPFKLFSDVEPRRCRAVLPMPSRTSAHSLRFDITAPAKKPYLLRGASVGRLYDLPPQPDAGTGPKLLFHASFDSSSAADTAVGSPVALAEKGVTYGPGIFGNAARFSPKAASRLEYAFSGNAASGHGAVSMWIRRDDAAVDSPANGWLFSTAEPFDRRIGTGSLYLWIWGGDKIRGDNSNDGDLSATRALPRDNKWHHVVFNWDRAAGATLFVDGVRVPGGTGGLDPVSRVFTAYTYSRSERPGLFDRFSVGSVSGTGAFDGWIDDFRIYSAPLGAHEVRRLGNAAGERAWRAESPDYAAMSAARGENPYIAPPLPKAGEPGEMQLVREWRFDGLKPDPSFRHYGDIRLGKLGDTAYVEAGSNRSDRFAMTFDVDPEVPFYILEFDYPDDTKRTMDIIVQEAGGFVDDYALQVGVLTGDDIPVSGRIRTHRCVYWTRPVRKAAFVAMTARRGGPAALSAFRMYRVKGGRLPAAAMKEPPSENGWGRTVGLYYEDAAVNYDFSVRDEGSSPEGALDMADRLAAVMKYTGENLFAYPGAWYDGFIGSAYNPRRHAPGFLSAFYERFDREGLGVMPLINQNGLHAPDPSWLTTERLRSGRIHETPVSIGASGFPEYHITLGPAFYNIAHPVMQTYFSRMIDAFIADGVKHRSFKGVGLHLKYSSLGWFGSLEGGYNDYCIEAFEKAYRVRVPVDRRDPSRGRLYAEWILANAREKWIRWRCDVCTGFWIRMAKKLQRARPDLKLWINNICVLDAYMDGFREPDYMRRTAIEGGIDAERFRREAPNVILGQTTLPADYRTTDGSLWFYRDEENRAYQRTMHLKAPYWDFVASAGFPFAHQHDRYWEDAAGNPRRNRVSGDALSGPNRDLDEHNWRVSTLNPAGEYAMNHYAESLLHHDMLGLSKGGYLIGTYGMEDHLAPFAQAFRALPPVKMRTLRGGGEKIRLRHADYAGKSYFYAVNASDRAVVVPLRFPEGTVEIVSGKRFAGMSELALGPYELRSFRAEKGIPAFAGAMKEVRR